MADKKTNVLTIYLIKESFNKENEIVAEVKNELRSEEIAGIGKLFYKKSSFKKPSWTSLFKGYDIIDQLFSASASCLLIMRVQNRFFVIPFGPAGRHFLHTGICEERFGLIVTLNSVKNDSIRSVDTKTLESEGMQTRKQLSKPSSTDEFGFNIEKDLVRSVTGLSKDEKKFGKGLCGKDSLRVSLKCDLVDIEAFLETFLEQFKKTDYKEAGFAWIDNLREINDPNKIMILQEKLLTEINSSVPSNLWITVPEILDWSDHGGFKFSNKKSGNPLDDIHIKTLKEHFNNSITLPDLMDNDVCRFSQSNEYQKDNWKIYDCIYFECSDEQETHFLTGGKWYVVIDNLVTTVNNYYDTIPKENNGINFIDYDHSHQVERDYNQALSSVIGGCCVDANLIQIVGKSKFEFCDVYTRNKQMIHIKKYSGSSALSHLFNQGFVSAKMLLSQDFRDKINKKLSPDFRIVDTSVRPNEVSGEYTVIYGIISGSEGVFKMPFFSKLTLMHVTKELKDLGFKVFLVKINNTKPSKIDDKN